MRNIIGDGLIVAMSFGLIFYLALQSIRPLKYAGAGFWEAVLLLIIFALGMYRLVVDLRERQ